MLSKILPLPLQPFSLIIFLGLTKFRQLLPAVESFSIRCHLTHASQSSFHWRKGSRPTLNLSKLTNPDCDNPNDSSNNGIQPRRDVVQKLLTSGTLFSLALPPSPAAAKNAKSRTAGYATQHTEPEWSQLLTSQQYFILRQGGTEPPYSSILEGEERSGLYACAGCGTPLFDSAAKFHSGTGWPSFATPIGSNVEMEEVSTIQYQLAGAEVRCQTCGGHLGDVFADGFLFVGTPAFVSGKRYCIDGGALLFVPKQSNGEIGGDSDMVRGDLPPKNAGRGPAFPG